ncbi:MAG: hypothetical protein ACK5KU_00640 [Beutenbergiaceae bacterium]
MASVVTRPWVPAVLVFGLLALTYLVAAIITVDQEGLFGDDRISVAEALFPVLVLVLAGCAGVLWVIASVRRTRTIRKLQWWVVGATAVLAPVLLIATALD